MPQGLVYEHFKFLLVRQLAYMAGAWRDLKLPLKSCTLFLVDLPEPLVYLIFLQTKLFRQLYAHLSGRHAPLLLLEDPVEHVHLVRVLPLPIPGVLAAANHLLEELLISDRRQVIV